MKCHIYVDISLQFKNSDVKSAVTIELGREFNIAEGWYELCVDQKVEKGPTGML